MNPNNWVDVWNRRHLSDAEYSTLQTLIYLDGFDSGAGRISEKDWTDYIHYIQNTIPIVPDDSIFEVGCGSGAFLYLFFLNGHNVGGLDYSEPLICKAASIFKTMSFTVTEALTLDTQSQYDIVLSNGVYHYFSDLDYAQKVTTKMIQKANRSVAILEIPDAALEAESENARRGMLPPDEYDKKYKGLKHLYYHKEWFEKIADLNNCTCSIYNQNINGYGNNQFRFNCILRKKS